MLRLSYATRQRSSISSCKIELDKNINVNEIAQLLNAIIWKESYCPRF